MTRPQGADGASGAVFHQGHHELHGITVVVDCDDGSTLIGRFDREQDDQTLLLNVAVHRDPDGRDEFIARAHRFGVRTDADRMLVDRASIVRVVRLGEAIR